MPITKLVRRVRNATRVPRLWIEATDQFSRGNLRESLAAIEEADELLGDLPPKFLMLFGLIMERHGNSKNAIRCFYQAAQKLRKSSQIPSRDEAEYLLCFAISSMNRVSANSRWKFNKEIVPRFDLVALSKVPASTKRTFPLVDHPDWEESN